MSGLNLALVKGARVTGRALDQSTSRPLIGITVAAYDASGRPINSATTDATGNYTLLLSPATYKLLAFDTSLQYATAYYQNASSFDAAPFLSLFEAQSLAEDFAMPLAGRISGIVTDASTGFPIAATIIAYDANGVAAGSTIADANGAFRLALVPGSYRIAATDPNHIYATVFYDAAATFEAASSINVAAAQEFSGVNLRMHAAPAPLRRRAAKH